MELITKLSGLLKAITYTIRVSICAKFKTVKGRQVYQCYAVKRYECRGTNMSRVEFVSVVLFLLIAVERYGFVNRVLVPIDSAESIK